MTLSSCDWNSRKNYKPKKLCSYYDTLDSFSQFKIKDSFAWCLNKVALEMPPYKLKATLLHDRYKVEYGDGAYEIPIEKQPCNYGGIRYFFHCPKCDRRVRLLYCVKGMFACRKCLNLGYFIQTLRPAIRYRMMELKYSKKIKLMGGDNYTKPPRMKRVKYNALRQRCWDYDQKWEDFELNQAFKRVIRKNGETVEDDW
jgi:hypothetical protein